MNNITCPCCNRVICPKPEDAFKIFSAKCEGCGKTWKIRFTTHFEGSELTYSVKFFSSNKAKSISSQLVDLTKKGWDFDTACDKLQVDEEQRAILYRFGV